MKHKVIYVEWIESEKGWGQRPDGSSLHLTKDDLKQYLDKYWERLTSNYGNKTPDEYSRTSSSPILVEVDEELYQSIKNTRHGLRLLKRLKITNLIMSGQLE